jgi:hypothetical protein
VKTIQQHAHRAISVVHTVNHSSFVYNWPQIHRRPLHTADPPVNNNPAAATEDRHR